MAATKLMLVSVLMFFEQCYFENANSEAGKKTNPEMLYKEEKKKKSCGKQRGRINIAYLYKSAVWKLTQEEECAAQLFIAMLLNATPAQKASNHWGDC